MTSPGPIALFVGGGGLPDAVCRLAAQPVLRIALCEAFAEGTRPEGCTESLSVGEIGRAMEILRAAGCRGVAFAGSLARPDWSQLRLDAAGAALLPQVLAAARLGDDALMRVVAGAFEAAGFPLIGLGTLAPGLVAAVGSLGASAPDSLACSDMAKAWAVAGALGQFDIGQGAVVADGLVLAVEAQEGTDLMLARVRDLPARLRGAPDARKGVLVKRLKPGQDPRLDAPVIGLATLEAAAAAGLSGIAVEAGGALIVDRAALAAAADRAGLFVYGIGPADGFA